MSGVRVMDRRSTIAGVLASATVFALPQWASGGRVVVQRGMVGGGLVESGESEAHFSLFASRLIVAEGQREVVAGRVLWVDVSDGLTMTSTQVTEYRVLPVPPEQGQAREIFGTMRVNGDGEYPFYSVVVDAGPPGSGLDTVSLIVGDDARTVDSATPLAARGFRYAAAGSISSGDVQLIELDIDPNPPPPLPPSPPPPPPRPASVDVASGDTAPVVVPLPPKKKKRGKKRRKRR